MGPNMTSTPYSHMMLHFNSIEQVPDYPGIYTETPSLHVHAGVGPTILANLLASGVGVEMRVRYLFQQWSLRTKSFSFHAHAECINLAHGIHLQILEAKSAQVALRASLRMEMDLRRLHALLEVEKAVCSDGITRAQTWSSKHHLLENLPDGSIVDNAIFRMMQRNYLQHKTFENSIR